MILKYNMVFNPLSANFTKGSNTLKQFVCNLPTNCLNVFDHFVGLVFKGLTGDPVLHLVRSLGWGKENIAQLFYQLRIT